MRGPPSWERTKSLAAFWAALMRFGRTSVEHMDAEISRASRIVADDDRIGTVACGRAAPTASTASPPASSPAGIRLLQRLRPGMAARTSAIEVTRTATRLRRRRVHHQQRERQCDERAGQRHLLLRDGEPEVEGRGDAVEFVGVRGGVVRAAG